MTRMTMFCRRLMAIVLLGGASATIFGECQDPTKEAGRFRIQGVEMTDTRTGLVWLRCPAGYVGQSGACDSSMVLPSTTWDSAMKGVAKTPQTPAGKWRLASVEEFETIAAKGCGYLVNPKYIELMFSTVWTSSSAGNDMVWLLGENGQRVKSAKNPKDPKSGGEFFAQTVYVRSANDTSASPRK
jgi:Protein of unknown function (DUF1566)